MGESTTMSERSSANPMPIRGGAVVVYPRSATWIGLLRCSLEASGSQIVAAATLTECDALLARWPSGLLVLEITAQDVTEQVRFLADVRDRRPAIRIVAVARDIDHEAERLLRELGVCDVVRHLADFQRVPAIALAHRQARERAEPDTIQSMLQDLGLTADF